jgi:DNA-binding CsgD family transcriptional regulator
MKRDPLHVIEAMYDVEAPQKAWLQQLADAADGALGCGRGVIANLYDASRPGPVRIEACASGTPSGFFEFFMGTPRQLDEGYVRSSYFSSTACALTSDFAGWADLPFVKSGAIAAWNIRDDLIVRGWEPGGRGVTLNVFQPQLGGVSAARRTLLARMASHLGAAHRLRRRLDARRKRDRRAEAVLDAKGRVCDAQGDAEQKAARARLSAAVQDMERARGSLRKRKPDIAVERWRALVAARWSLVDEFQEGTRRYIIAYANELTWRGPELLTSRERQVVAYAVAGHWTKLIAYDLGISPSTVRVLLARAMAKLGVRSRDELVRVASAWTLKED